MSQKPLTELAADAMKTAGDDAARAPTPEERARHLDLMATAIDRERRRRRQRTYGMLAMAAVILVGATAAWRATRTPGETPRATLETPRSLRVLGGDAAIRRGEATVVGPLQTGDRVEARTASTLGLANGTRVKLGNGARVEVVRTGDSQVLALAHGTLGADVVKLTGDERFIVKTADVEVEVRGTSFQVETLEQPTSCEPRTETRVLVTEGVVVVRQGGTETPIRAGESWPPACEKAAPTTTTPPAPSASAPAPSASATTEPRDATPNDLYAKAVAARRAGDNPGSVKALDELLAKYPKSSLVEASLVERMRALDGYDHERSAAAARDYIARFPKGFARGEAEAILALH